MTNYFLCNSCGGTFAPEYIYCPVCHSYDPTLIYRLEERARIRRSITTRKSVQNNESDKIADLLEEAAQALKESNGNCKCRC